MEENIVLGKKTRVADSGRRLVLFEDRNDKSGKSGWNRNLQLEVQERLATFSLNPRPEEKYEWPTLLVLYSVKTE